jgi:hypothetical protein
MTNAIKVLLQMTSVSLQPVPSLHTLLRNQIKKIKFLVAPNKKTANDSYNKINIQNSHHHCCHFVQVLLYCYAH